MTKTTDKITTAYQRITDRILEHLEAGVIPWRKPWTADDELPTNLQSRKAYRGVNVMLLAIAGMMRDFSSPYWMTYKQAKAMGGHVRRGEKGETIVFWKILRKTETVDGEEVERRFPLLRTYTVFNLDQIEDLPESKLPAKPERTNTDTPVEAADAIVASMPQRPEISFGGARAYYRPSADTVQLPERSTFAGEPEFCSVRFHELVHSTGHPSRLNRRAIEAEIHDSERERYADEELTAEIGAAMLNAAAGIEDERTIENTAAYIETWRQRISDDPKLVIVAAQRAQRAADFVTGRLEAQAAAASASDSTVASQAA